MRKSVAGVLFALVWVGAAVSYAGDAGAGKIQAAPCIACHGIAGHHSNPLMPGLAGQNVLYTVSQLKAYKEKTRNHRIMNALSGRLSEADMENIAVYYAGLKPMLSAGDPSLTASGNVTYALCVKCHGEDGSGKGLFPRLSGQQPGYTLRELRAYKIGTRKNPIMNSIAGALSEGEMEALSAYLADLK